MGNLRLYADQSLSARNLREAIQDVADQLETEIAPSRESSLAITKLEEAIYWASAAFTNHKEDISNAQR